MAEQTRAKRPPRLFTVSAVQRLTPHMIRVTFSGPKIADIPDGCEGANCKIFLPEPSQSKDSFARQLEEGPRPTVRTYTVRHQRQAVGEMDIDFVDHGDAGPASAWARAARVGSFCGFAGPGPVKVESYYAKHYLVVADMSALPLAAATLEAMPADARGTAIFDIPHAQDQQDFRIPEGIEQHWIVNADSHAPTGEIVDMVRGLDWPAETVQVCIAGESTMIKELRQHILVDLQTPKQDVYISGYWKIGLIEDEHQKAKRLEASAA